jgi:hypothetical protein
LIEPLFAGSRVEGARPMTQASRETHAKSSGHFLDELRATFAARADQDAVCFKDRSFT